MPCKSLITLLVVALSFSQAVSAQQIDDTIARELGLVREPAKSLQSAVVDVVLNVGQPRELVFPEQGTLDIDSEDANKFEFLNVNNSLFISSLENVNTPITATFKLAVSKEAVVLRIKTVKKPVESEPLFVKVRSKRSTLAKNHHRKSLPAVPGRSLNRGIEYDRYVTLVSFAARSAFAPDRLLNPPKGISQQPIKANSVQLKRLVRERRLKVTPLAAYTFRGLHLTVMQLENKGNANLRLVPELIRGAFIAKSFHHNSLGTLEQDRYSAVYLISQRPFNEIIQEL